MQPLLKKYTTKIKQLLSSGIGFQPLTEEESELIEQEIDTSSEEKRREEFSKKYGISNPKCQIRDNYERLKIHFSKEEIQLINDETEFFLLNLDRADRITLLSGYKIRQPIYSTLIGLLSLSYFLFIPNKPLLLVILNSALLAYLTVLIVKDVKKLWHLKKLQDKLDKIPQIKPFTTP